MERIRNENETREIERNLRIKAAEDKRERDEKLLRSMKLAVEVNFFV